jgi:hypothetical protein
MQWDDNILEENNVLVSQGYCESTNDTSQNVEELGGTIKFMIFMNKREETFIHRFSNHFSSRHQFGVKFVQNVLQVISLDRFLGVKELEELLDELRSYINLQRSHFNRFIND